MIKFLFPQTDRSFLQLVKLTFPIKFWNLDFIKPKYIQSVWQDQLPILRVVEWVTP